MKKFRENNPLIFYGVIVIIGLSIYSKWYSSQTQKAEAIAKTAELEKQREEERRIKQEYQRKLKEEEYQRKLKEEEYRKNIEEVRKSREEQLAMQNDPNRSTYIERHLALSLARVQGEVPKYMGERPGLLKKGSIYRDDYPYGQLVSIYFDEFYKKFHINFYNQDGNEVHFVLREENFEYYGIKKSIWSFKYKGSIYRIE